MAYLQVKMLSLESRQPEVQHPKDIVKLVDKLKKAGGGVDFIVIDGADACYMGSVLLMTTSHLQSLTALPYEPPTQMIFYKGKYKNKFNIEKGANSLYNYLLASRVEIEQGIRALGKTDLQKVNKEDLMEEPKKRVIRQFTPK